MLNWIVSNRTDYLQKKKKIDLAPITYKGWYAIKPKQPKNYQMPSHEKHDGFFKVTGILTVRGSVIRISKLSSNSDWDKSINLKFK